MKFLKVGSKIINFSGVLLVDAYDEEDKSFNIYLSNGIILKIIDSPDCDAEELREKLENLMLGQNVVKFKQEFDV
jgi:hypothetical protein